MKIGLKINRDSWLPSAFALLLAFAVVAPAYAEKDPKEPEPSNGVEVRHESDSKVISVPLVGTGVKITTSIEPKPDVSKRESADAGEHKEGGGSASDSTQVEAPKKH